MYSLGQDQQWIQPQPRLGLVTIHDACPAFSTKIFELADELEGLDWLKKAVDKRLMSEITEKEEQVQLQSQQQQQQEEEQRLAT